MLNEDDKEEEEGGDNNEEEIDEDEVVGKISEVVDWDGSEKEDVVLEKEEEVEKRQSKYCYKCKDAKQTQSLPQWREVSLRPPRSSHSSPFRLTNT